MRAWRGSPGLERPVGGEISVGIPVEPTMDGRFWSVVISNGDSHWHSDNELVLRGIPPYIAQSPEQWFDPAVGEPAAVALPHHDRDLKPDRFAHHMPNTWLGDQSYSGFVGPARIRIKNSQLGPLTFGLGMYTLSTDDWRAGIAVRDSDGTVLDRLTVHQPAEEWNVNEHRLQLKSPPKGVFTVEANGNHHFLWTDPALPMVVMPDEGSNSLTFEFSGPRHWYFQVPAKTDKFTVTVHCPRERDKAVVEVHAPDRLMRIADAVEGTATALVIEVPENLRGQRWFLRIYPSSGTDYAGPDTAKYHRPTVTAKITIDGVPFRLSPTWGQWFDEQAQ